MVDNDRGGGGGSSRCRRSGHQSRDERGRDGEAGIGVNDSTIGSRRREYPHGNDMEEGEEGGQWRQRHAGERGGWEQDEEGGGGAAAIDLNRWPKKLSLLHFYQPTSYLRQ